MQLEVQRATAVAELPDDDAFQRWVDSAVQNADTQYSVVIRLVDEAESRELNHAYRHKDYATNVLSFPFEVPDFVDQSHLGDLVICAQVVVHEASEQGKPPLDHWAHMVIHGMLHLQGYDHIEDSDAEQMEALEIRILQQLNICNPYEA